MRTKLTIWRYRLWRFRLTTVGIVLASFGAATALVNPPRPVSVAAGLAGATLSFMETRANRRRSEELRFQPREGDKYKDVVDQSVALGPSIESARDVGIMLCRENAELRKRPIRAILQTPDYVLPRDLRTWSLDYLTRRAKTGKIYNDRVLCLASDLLGDDVAKLRAARYFDFLCSNLLAPLDVWEVGRKSPALRGRDLILDPEGRLIPFRRSRLANIIGVSTLAFTTDGQLLLVSQTPENMGSPGLLAPSGSGALEPKDMPHNMADWTIQTIVINGAERELQEECHLEANEIQGSAVVGHGRWISRGAMPEFCAATLLRLTGDQMLDRSVRRVERSFVHEVMPVSLAPVRLWDPRQPLEMLPRKHRDAVSWPLALGLACLAECINDESWPLRNELISRLAG
ncbi:hypothetical protein [Micromonospora profundi]|uniref:hypothetical protein n=1 Tax=Micromonospora TaxID=1873 RepID=UPI0033A53F06